MCVILLGIYIHFDVYLCVCVHRDNITFQENKKIEWKY